MTVVARSSAADWTEANQRYLVAEFARLKARLDGQESAEADRELEQARAVMPARAAIDQLTEAFDLTPFERDVLLLCAGVEMDPDLSDACARRADPSHRGFVTFRLALATLDQQHWSALTPNRPLRFWRLLEVSDEHVVASSRISIDERVLHYLAGVNYLDARLRPFLRAHAAHEVLADSHAATAESITQTLEQFDGNAPVVQLIGGDSAGQRDIAATVTQRLGLRLYVLRGTDIPGSAPEADRLAMWWDRESILLGGALLVERTESVEEIVARFVDRPGGLICISAAHPLTLDRPDVRFAVNAPGALEQKRLWMYALGAAATSRLNGALDGIGTQFRLSAHTIFRTAERLRAPLLSSATPDALLWHECRVMLRHRLDELAQRVEPLATWHDLVLPQPQLATLRQIAVHLRQRLKVYDEWGFARTSARGLGITALFSGESGTGKTMAAEVLANDLHLDLYRIDLAGVVSKYIGETEKNLRRVFDAAEDSGAILLFDEADALFGKRSEVKDSHDRYANIEVSYLLQRMEAYRGLAILTTNAGAALDPAFQRRLRFAVQFPFPDQAQREQIWRGAFPRATPLEGVDPTRLAQLNVAGGGIRNIAMTAAFLAADAGVSVGMPHLLQAARSEAAKRDRPFSEAEVRGWV
jgi:hypothetical protein